MAPSESTNVTRIKQVYTISEAVEYMKMKDRNMTVGVPVTWINVRTGKRVIIGYTS